MRFLGLAFILSAVIMGRVNTSPAGASVPGASLSSRSCPAPDNYLCGTQKGDGTFFNPGLGACGITNTDSDLIAAISAQAFDNYPGATSNTDDNPICNMEVTAQFEGKEVTVAIVDLCPNCAGPTDLNFSPAAFEQLADLSLGRIAITWAWA